MKKQRRLNIGKLFCAAALPCYFLGMETASAQNGRFSVDNVREIVPADGMHMAFPKLISHEGAYYLGYLESSTHISKDGVAKVMRSPNGKQWTPFADIVTPDSAPRAPVLAKIKPEGPIHAYVPAGNKQAGTHLTYGATLPDSTGNQFREIDASPINTSLDADVQVLFGRYSDGKKLYATIYWAKSNGVHHVGLLTTEDGTNWSTLLRNFIPNANETDIVIHGNKLYALARCYGRAPSKGAILDLDSMKVERFNFDKEIDAPVIFTCEGQDYAIGRAGGEQGEAGPFTKNERQTTALFRIDWTGRKLDWVLNFPHGDGRDNAYAEIAPLEKDRFLVVYYSSDGGADPHNDPTSIWSAELRYESDQDAAQLQQN